ncbi:MAG: hypothetical protein Q7J14_00860 [Candidatus Magasanikbacteria bacterium]|nr:hypothetical protein [Candidatus Magasanikbacteria bacterium]
MITSIGTLFGFSVSLTFWQIFMDMNLTEQIKTVFVFLWWLPITPLFYNGLKLFLSLKQKRFDSTCTWSVLAVDIPAAVIQSPRAVEQVFTHLSGIYNKISVYDKYWLGKKQKNFSLEIISLEGYIQFLVRSPGEFRDLVEAAIYAQYPEAEITEVEDYVVTLPDKFPDDRFDVAGIEFDMNEDDSYPIRTYTEFEHSLYKDAPFIDPMAAILENFTRVGAGENLWMQLIVEPVDNNWKKKGIELVKNLAAGKKAPPKPNAAQGVADVAEGLLKLSIQAWNNDFSKEEKKKDEKGEVAPGVKVAISGIENKISKLGFKSRLRLLYSARKEIFNPKKCVNGFIGSINQFYIANQNGLKANTIKKAEKAVSAFKKRKMKIKTDPYILNIEELATVWHFPMPTVKAPLIQKAGGKRSEPPTNLPIEILEGGLKYTEDIVIQKEPEPEDLPYA